MTDELKRIDCAPECGFAVQSHNEREVVDYTKNHMKSQHHKNMSDQELRDTMKTVAG